MGASWSSETLMYNFVITWHHSPEVCFIAVKTSNFASGTLHDIGMMSFLDSEGVMRLDRSKDVSVHVSTCTSYDFESLMLVMWKLWR
jgi:hypothetical protein